MGAVDRQLFAGPREAADIFEISFDPFVELQMLIFATAHFQPAETRPLPARWIVHQSPFDRIVVAILSLLYRFLHVPDIEIMSATGLPLSITLRTRS